MSIHLLDCKYDYILYRLRDKARYIYVENHDFCLSNAMSRDKMGINGHLTTFSLIFSLKYLTLVNFKGRRFIQGNNRRKNEP